MLAIFKVFGYNFLAIIWAKKKGKHKKKKKNV